MSDDAPPPPPPLFASGPTGVFERAVHAYNLLPFTGAMMKWRRWLDDPDHVRQHARGVLATALFTLLAFVDSCLRGYAQVVFVNNPLSGLVVLAALLYGDRWLGLQSMVGVVASTLQGKVLGLKCGWRGARC